MKWLSFIALLVPLIADAGVGRRLSQEDIFPQQCFMDYGTDERRYTEICTGILVDQDTVITAAHCVADGLPHTLSCGPEAKRVEVQEVLTHPRFEPEVVIEEVVHLVKDLAVIELKNPIPAQKIPFMKMSDLAKADRCAFFGYSKLSLKSRENSSVPQFGWEVSKDALELWSEYQMIRLHGLKAPGGLSEVGDSGGPLMCEINGRWNLLGVASARDYAYHSIFTPVVDESFPVFPKDGAIKLQRTAERQNKEFFLRGEEIEKERLLNAIRKISKIAWLAEQNSASTYQKIYLNALSHLFDKPGHVGRLKAFSTFKKAGDSKVYSVGDLAYNYFEVLEIDFVRGEVRGNLKVLGPSDTFTCGEEILCKDELIKNVTTDIRNFEMYYLERMP